MEADHTENGVLIPRLITLQERVLEASTRQLGPEHPGTLTAMSNLGKTLCDRGDLEGAQKLQERVLEARTRLLGLGDPETLAAMGNLAGTRCTLKGNTCAERRGGIVMPGGKQMSVRPGGGLPAGRNARPLLLASESPRGPASLDATEEEYATYQAQQSA